MLSSKAKAAIARKIYISKIIKKFLTQKRHYNQKKVKLNGELYSRNKNETTANDQTFRNLFLVLIWLFYRQVTSTFIKSWHVIQD